MKKEFIKRNEHTFYDVDYDYETDKKMDDYLNRVGLPIVSSCEELLDHLKDDKGNRPALKRVRKEDNGMIKK